jgi:hypothetical protein
LLTPGQTYYYVVVTKNQQGTVTQSSVQSFTTKGLTVSIGVFDKNHHAIVGKLVTLHSTATTATTNSQGYATFSNVIPGSHSVDYANGSKSYTEPIAVQNDVQTVNGTQIAPVQNVSVVYSALVVKSNAALIRGSLLALLLVVVVVAVMVVTRKKVRFAAPGGAPLTAEPVIVGGPHGAVNPNDPTLGSLTSQQTSDHLQNIPAPNKPEPGSMFVPKEDSEDKDTEGKGL